MYKYDKAQKKLYLIGDSLTFPVSDELDAVLTDAQVIRAEDFNLLDYEIAVPNASLKEQNNTNPKYIDCPICNGSGAVANLALCHYCKAKGIIKNPDWKAPLTLTQDELWISAFKLIDEPYSKRDINLLKQHFTLTKK